MTTTMPDLDAQTIERMRPIWEAADIALRRDPHMLADLAELARDAVAEKRRDVERDRKREAARLRANDAARAKRAALRPEEREAMNATARATYAAKAAAAIQAPNLDVFVDSGALD